MNRALPLLLRPAQRAVETPESAPAPDAEALAAHPFGLSSVYLAREGASTRAAVRLRPLVGATPRLDAAGLHGYLCFSHVPLPLTAYSGITRLLPGEEVDLSTGAIRATGAADWQESEGAFAGVPEAAAELRELLLTAAAACVEGAEEAGVFLSGGLDSSLVAALLIRLGLRVRLYTLDFGPPHDAELPLARAVADHLEQPLTVVRAGPKEVRAALEPAARELEQPFGDAVTVPLYLLGRAAAQEVPVIFNGEGGDQLFGGWANKPMIAAEAYGAPGYDRTAAYLRTYHRFHGLTDALYTPRARAATAGLDPGGWVRPDLEAEGFRSLIHRLRAANLLLKGAQNIAPRAAQLAAAHGLALRAPFFDPDLARWTFTLPPEWLLHGACEKFLLKVAAAPYLPEEIVWREKRGMGVPVTEWCLGPLRREIARRLSPLRLRRDGWFQSAFVEALRRGEDHPGEFRSRRLGEKLWCLLMLHVWLDVQERELRWPL